MAAEQAGLRCQGSRFVQICPDSAESGWVLRGIVRVNPGVSRRVQVVGAGHVGLGWLMARCWARSMIYGLMFDAASWIGRLLRGLQLSGEGQGSWDLVLRPDMEAVLGLGWFEIPAPRLRRALQKVALSSSLSGVGRWRDGTTGVRPDMGVAASLGGSGFPRLRGGRLWSSQE